MPSHCTKMRAYTPSHGLPDWCHLASAQSDQLSWFAQESPNFKMESPASPETSQAPGHLGGLSTLLLPSSPSPSLTKRWLADVSAATWGLLSVSRTHCPNSFPPRAFALAASPLRVSSGAGISLTCHPGLVLARHATLLITWLQISCVYYSTPVTYMLKNHVNCCYDEEYQLDEKAKLSHSHCTDY